MKTVMRTWLAVVLASSLALGEGAPPAAKDGAPEPAPAPVPAPAPPPPSESAIDLDFGEDPREVTPTLPSAVPLAAPEPERSWIYWTLGFTGLAAGGAAWYLHWGDRPAPAPIRKDQVFTDDPD